MKNRTDNMAEAETLDAQRIRRFEQLATVETEIGAVDAELQAMVAEREPLTLRSLDDPASDAALESLEERAIKASARQRALSAKGDALRKEIAALDDKIRRRDYGAGVAAFRAEHTDLVAIAHDADQKSAAAAEALQLYEASADALQRRGRALGFSYLNRLTDRDVAAGSLMRLLDPRREIAPQIHPRYRRSLSEQAADALPGWVLDAVDPPPEWQPATTTQAPLPDGPALEPETEAAAEAAA